MSKLFIKISYNFYSMKKHYLVLLCFVNTHKYENKMFNQIVSITKHFDWLT